MDRNKDLCFAFDYEYSRIEVGMINECGLAY